MATFDDRLLGEKLQYYCSSSEDEADEIQRDTRPQKIPSTSRRNTSSNTGPKGVIQDWRNFKQLQNQEREEKEAATAELIKKLSLTCSSHGDDERNKETEEQLEDLLDEKFMMKYFEKRMSEMMAAIKPKTVFKTLLHLDSAEEFLHAIDAEKDDVIIVIHIYEKSILGCDAMNGCLQCLAKQYPSVKFCKIEASCAGLSKHFSVSGVPALLVYKGGSMVGNYVRLTDDLGEDFYSDEVECFLIENGILPNPTLVPEVISSMDDEFDD